MMEGRLTRKTFFGDYGWEAANDEEVKAAEVRAINKLGRLEDLMERHNVSEESLEKRLEALEIIKNKVLRITELDVLEVRDEVELTTKECELLMEVL